MATRWPYWKRICLPPNSLDYSRLQPAWDSISTSGARWIEPAISSLQSGSTPKSEGSSKVFFLKPKPCSRPRYLGFRRIHRRP